MCWAEERWRVPAIVTQCRKSPATGTVGRVVRFDARNYTVVSFERAGGGMWRCVRELCPYVGVDRSGEVDEDGRMMGNVTCLTGKLLLGPGPPQKWPSWSPTPQIPPRGPCDCAVHEIAKHSQFNHIGKYPVDVLLRTYHTALGQKPAALLVPSFRGSYPRWVSHIPSLCKGKRRHVHPMDLHAVPKMKVGDQVVWGRERITSADDKIGARGFTQLALGDSHSWC